MCDLTRLLVTMTLEDFFAALDEKFSERLAGMEKPLPKDDLPEWMTRNQVRAYLQVKSLTTIDNYARRGLLTKKYVGGSPRFHRDEVRKVFELL